MQETVKILLVFQNFWQALQLSIEEKMQVNGFIRIGLSSQSIIFNKILRNCDPKFNCLLQKQSIRQMRTKMKSLYMFQIFSQVQIGMTGKSKWLDHSNLFKRVVGLFESTFRPVILNVRRKFTRSLQLQAKATSPLVHLFSRPYLHTNTFLLFGLAMCFICAYQYLTKIASVFAYQDQHQSINPQANNTESENNAFYCRIPLCWQKTKRNRRNRSQRMLKV